MATLINTLRFLSQRGRPVLCHQQRYAGHWNKNWKPGPIPQTPEERAASAKRYGLRPEDYNCLVEGEMGEYPFLPVVSPDSKDPYEVYDLPGESRNYMEPIYHNAEHVGVDKLDTDLPENSSYGMHFLRFALVFCGFAGAFLFFQKYPFTLPEMPRQYPFNNLYLERGGNPDLAVEVKHYTFEPATEE